jgi:class 3 adenylate cyclase
MNWKSNGQTEPKPTCERFWTTLFFADISGFTRLSARLNAEQVRAGYYTILYQQTS